MQHIHMSHSRFVYIQLTRGKAVASVEPHDEKATEFTTALDHPRTLVDDYHGLEGIFGTLLDKLDLRAWYKRKPWALAHLPDPAEGGYTSEEKRAFCVAAIGAGCSEAWFMDSQVSALSKEKLEEVRSLLSETRQVGYGVLKIAVGLVLALLSAYLIFDSVELMRVSFRGHTHSFEHSPMSFFAFVGIYAAMLVAGAGLAIQAFREDL